jgi:hypothetical protein
MPNIDGGHYFLSTLIPVDLTPIKRDGGGFQAPSHWLREVLASLPTAEQSPAAVAAGFSSPFSRCTRTHFARFVVIDQPMFNGRNGGDALRQALRRTNLLAHQPVDSLSRPYLMFTADFDARPDEPDGGFASWAKGCWTTMEPEMRAVFATCIGFAAVDDGEAFAAWLARCQIETTMSFNDYYVPAPDLGGFTLAKVGIGIGVVTLALTAASAWYLLRANASLWWLLAAVPVAALVAIVGAVALLSMRGRKPFPTGANTDLPSVLKALHVQQRFALMAAELQGADAATVHARFGEFLAQVKPDTVTAPTQPPGVIRSDGVPLVAHARVVKAAEV